MENTTLSAMVALKEEISVALRALGHFPKKDPFDHGVQVGVWQGLSRALEIVDAVQRDEEVRQNNL